MNYLYVNSDFVLQEVIQENDPLFPGVPVEERYTQEFLAGCVKRSDEQMESEGIQLGMLYDAESDTFSALPEPEPKPEGYTITEEEVSAAYEEGVNNVE